MPILYTLAALGAVLLILAAVVLTRTFLFRPKRLPDGKTSPVFVNSERAVNSLRELVRCKTVSDSDRSLEDESEFLRFEQKLTELFPAVSSKCGFEKVSDRSLLFRWQGRSSASPVVLMAHYDVVGAVDEDWDKPPFEGVYENGVLWGRGTLDTKISLNAILEAAETLIDEGFVPANDVYFAFGGNEEVNGDGARRIAELFASRGITPAFVLDEGGAVVSDVFPGVKLPSALIGIAEKGTLSVHYSVKGGGGHASAPASHTPVGKLAAACVRVEKKKFRFRLTKPAREMLNVLPRYSTFFYRMMFANLWLFAPLLNFITRISGGELNALVRTTTAFTCMEGSHAINVIPPKAYMASNHRIIAGDSTEKILADIKKTVKDPDIEVTSTDGIEPSVISSISCAEWETVCRTVSETWQNVIVSPYLMIACSDSRHWGSLTDRVYRFSPMTISNEERATIHGNNERVPARVVAKAVEFYIRLMKKL